MGWMSVLDNYIVQQNMSDYGSSWFKFDEPIGDLIDSKGNQTGVITGATRVVGWDNTGYALSFNGTSNYIQFGSPLAPIKSPIGSSNLNQDEP